MQELAVFEGLREPEAVDAHAWALEHLPPPEPSGLITGTFGQNILLAPGKAPAVIDWEYAGLGDPAYDLAIVTRCVRRPFQIERGFGRLIEAYRDAGGVAVEPTHIRMYELALAAKWYRDSLDPAATGGHPPSEPLARLRRVLNFATSRSH